MDIELILVGILTVIAVVFAFIRSRKEEEEIAFEFYLDPGNAPTELITELLIALNNLWVAHHGGHGLKFEVKDGYNMIAKIRKLDS